MKAFIRTVIVSLIALIVEAHSTERNALKYLSRIEDPVLHTPSHHVHSYSSFELTFSLHARQQDVRLSLQPNLDVLADGASVKYLNPDGTVKYQEPIVRTDHRVFKGDAFIQHPGHSEWLNAGWARMILHRDGERPVFEGAFRVNGDNHHIQTSTNYRLTQHHEDPVIAFADDEYMVVWRDSDIRPDDEEFGELKRDLNDAPVCSSDRLGFNNELTHPVFTGLDVRDTSAIDARSLFGRQIDGTTGGNGAGVNLTSTIGSTAGCPSTRKVALVGIAADCSYMTQFNGSQQNARLNIINFVNSASQVYESAFNISLGIHDLNIVNETCPGTAPSTTPWNVGCSDSVSITDRLNEFSSWRGQQNDSNAYWTLLTNCKTGSAVGLAWLGQLCTQGSSTSTSSDGNETTAGANVVAFSSPEWAIFAHETGHIFGAVHDCTSSTCSDGTASKQQCCPLSSSTCDAGGRFIMNPSTGDDITQFSACSIGNICSALGRNSVRSTCLANNKDVTTISGQQCGNGIVESGEDCDCGGTEGCGDNPCCDPTTCKFKANAVCDPSNEDCCTSQCQFASNGTVCRKSTGSCDPAETCTGDAANCPADVTAPDGQSCGASNSGLACASGQCTSRDLQCKTVVGALTSNNDTYACDSQGCLLSCASSSLGANTCYDMQQYFLDGTPCQGGGKCQNGQCKGSNFGNEVKSWIQDNKNIVIPIAAVVGTLVLIGVVSCIVSCCRRRRVRKIAAKQPTASWQSGSSGGLWNDANMGGARQGQVQVPPPPRGPPPAYAQVPPMYSACQEQFQQWGGSRGRIHSTRYA